MSPLRQIRIVRRNPTIPPKHTARSSPGFNGSRPLSAKPFRQKSMAEKFRRLRCLSPFSAQTLESLVDNLLEKYERQRRDR